jgi:cytochrome bd-type quinol oxidase subunit 2
MFKNLSRKIATIAASLSLAFIPIAVPITVHAADNPIRDNLCQGVALHTATGSGGCEAGAGAAEAQSLVTNIINIFSLVVGIVAVVMIIIGGFKYITSNGDSGNISSAKTTIMYAIIGLVVVAFAQLIVQFVLDKVSSST